jgi:Transglycosylase-like domain
MPIHDIDPFPRSFRGAYRGRLRAAAVATGAIAALTALPGVALASTGGSSAPPAEQQQTTAASSQPTGGATAQPASHKKKKHKKHHIKLPKELKKIAMCESGGDPKAVSPSGRYRGKYQFDMPTWHSVGGKGDPIDAPEWKQDKLALKLYRERGTAPWPNCA